MDLLKRFLAPRSIVQLALFIGFQFFILSDLTFHIGNLAIFGALIAGIFLGISIILSGQDAIARLGKSSGWAAVVTGAAIIIFFIAIALLTGHHR